MGMSHDAGHVRDLGLRVTSLNVGSQGRGKLLLELIAAAADVEISLSGQVSVALQFVDEGLYAWAGSGLQNWSAKQV
jgi:hypothetical protein